MFKKTIILASTLALTEALNLSKCHNSDKEDNDTLEDEPSPSGLLENQLEKAAEEFAA